MPVTVMTKPSSSQQSVINYYCLLSGDLFTSYHLPVNMSGGIDQYDEEKLFCSDKIIFFTHFYRVSFKMPAYQYS